VYGEVSVMFVSCFFGLVVTPEGEAVSLQIRSKDSQVKTQLVLRIFILFKVTI